MELFTISFSFQGVNYEGAVSFHVDQYNNPYYKVKLTAGDLVTNVELIPEESRTGETFWKDRCPDTTEPREVLNSELIREIGKAIEKHAE
jgi:hypothetical protein